MVHGIPARAAQDCLTPGAEYHQQTVPDVHGIKALGDTAKAFVEVSTENHGQRRGDMTDHRLSRVPTCILHYLSGPARGRPRH